MLRFGKAQSERPVLFYEEDAQLIFISRMRERLAETFRFVIADAALIDDVIDKARFSALAERLGLPVPAARQFHPVAVEPGDLDLHFPVIIKPLTRLERWSDTFGLRKALDARDAESLRALWPQLLDVGTDLLVAGTHSRHRSANRELPLLRRSTRQHCRRIHRPENSHFPAELRP